MKIFKDEIEYSDDIEIFEKKMMNSNIDLESSDFPITIKFEGRKKYVLRLTENDCLVLNKKD